MVFVRLKKVKGKDYAYLVKNEWKKGKVKQKTVKYLGRANKYESGKISEFMNVNPLASILSNSLTNAGFSDKLKHEKVTVSLQRKKVLNGRKEGAIILNEGILSSQTLQELLNYEPLNEERPGVRLANTLQNAGIKVTNECFINLYKVLHDT
jgi:hypothetical protein